MPEHVIHDEGDPELLAWFDEMRASQPTNVPAGTPSLPQEGLGAEGATGVAKARPGPPGRHTSPLEPMWLAKPKRATYAHATKPGHYGPRVTECGTAQASGPDCTTWAGTAAEVTCPQCRKRLGLP